MSNIEQKQKILLKRTTEVDKQPIPSGASHGELFLNIASGANAHNKIATMQIGTNEAIIWSDDAANEKKFALKTEVEALVKEVEDNELVTATAISTMNASAGFNEDGSSVLEGGMSLSEAIIDLQARAGVIEESDPIFAKSAASGITSADITNWNNKMDAVDRISSAYTSYSADTSVSAKTSVSASTSVSATTSTKAIQDGDGQVITSTYSKTGHTHNASAITGGTFNIARIPTGTSSTTVARGDHSHTAAEVGLESALKYHGVTTTPLTDGATTKPITIGGVSHYQSAGCVVIYTTTASGDTEFVWNGSSWEKLGDGINYKVKQEAVSDPAANGSALTFIDTISQDTNGVIKPTKKSVNLANYSLSGHNHDDRYYTESEMNSKLNAKQNTISDLGTIRTNASNGATAYGWGNHANAGYTKNTGTVTSVKVQGTNGLTGSGTVTASGTITISGVTATTGATGVSKLVTGDLKGKTYADGMAASQAHTHSQYLTGLPSHNHDDRYYTESEINTKLAGKSDTGHTHNASAITGGTFDTGRIPKNIKVNSASTADSATTAKSATTVPWDGVTNKPSIAIYDGNNYLYAPSYINVGIDQQDDLACSSIYFESNYDRFIRKCSVPRMKEILGVSDSATTESGHYSPTGKTSTYSGGWITGIKLDSKKHVTEVTTGSTAHTHSEYATTTAFNDLISDIEDLSNKKVIECVPRHSGSMNLNTLDSTKSIFTEIRPSEITTTNLPSDFSLSSYGALLSLRDGSSNYGHSKMQLIGQSDGHGLWFRCIQGAGEENNGTWKRLVLHTEKINSATTATKLNKTCKIWGQDFDGTNNITGELKINDKYSINHDANGLVFNSELKITAAGTSDICTGIKTDIKSNRMQVTNLISQNIILGSSNGASASNLPLKIQKYGSITDTAPATLTDLVTFDLNGNITAPKFIGTATSATTAKSASTISAIPGAGKYWLLGHSNSSNGSYSAYKNANVYMENGSLYASSDKTLKTHVENVNGDPELIKRIPKAYFHWNDDKGKNIQMGTYAQDLEEVYPELVTKGEDGIRGVAYDRLGVVALAGIDKLYEMIQQLQAKNDELENRIKELENK